MAGAGDGSTPPDKTPTPPPPELPAPAPNRSEPEQRAAVAKRRHRRSTAPSKASSEPGNDRSAPDTQRAVLDTAHTGDIRGAFGTIRQHDTAARRSPRARLHALLAIMGPGLIVMIGDNDAGGVATYAQAGQNYGTSLLWLLLLLIPVVVVNQEMVVRLGAVTGVGHARLIFERFGRFWGAFSVGDLFLLNFLTIVTEFIGVALALGYFGVSAYISVPLAALLLIATTITGSFRRWERIMYVFIIGNLLVVPLAIFSHPHANAVLHGAFVPGIRGGVNSTSILLVIAIVGTTVAPWQLFFQQSNVIDKRITPRWINYERADTIIGGFVVVAGAACIMITTAFAFGHTPLAGHFGDAGTVATGLSHYLGRAVGATFAIVLLNASLIGASAVTLSTSYAFGDAFGVRHSLHRSFREARFFYGTYAALVALAGVIVVIPGAPLGVITTAVQALAGVLLPSATVFLLLLCNDADVLGPWMNPRWLNAVAAAVVGVLLVLSGILTATTVFPSINVATLSLVLAGILIAGGCVFAWLSRRPTRRERFAGVDRYAWTMPPLALLEKPVWSPARRAAMLLMRIYLFGGVVLVAVKAIQLGGGH